MVVNCSAYNFVDKAEAERDAAMAVNAWAVYDLAMICRDLDVTSFTSATDYVFGLDAGRSRPWTEDDPPGPLSVYGLSKLAGEYLVRSTCPKHFVIRTCGLYGVRGSGGKGGNFVETMLRLAGNGKPLRVVNDQRCTPSYTADVAAAVARVVGDEPIRALSRHQRAATAPGLSLPGRYFVWPMCPSSLSPISSA